MSRVVILALAGLLAALVAGLAAASRGQEVRRAGVPPGFPTRWKPTGGELLGIEHPGPRQTVHFVSVLKGTNGRQAYYFETFREWRRAVGTVTCGGKRYSGPFTADVRNPGEGWFGVAGFGGTAHFRITRMVQAASDTGGPPTCTEESGTWIGETSMLRGASGTYSISKDGTLTLR